MVRFSQGNYKLQSRDSKNGSLDQDVDMLSRDISVFDDKLLLRAVLQSPHTSPSVRHNYSTQFSSSNYFSRINDLSHCGFDLLSECTIDMKPPSAKQTVKRPVSTSKIIDTGYRPIHRIGTIAKTSPSKWKQVLAKRRTSDWVIRTMNLHRRKEFADKYKINNNCGSSCESVLDNGPSLRKPPSPKSPSPEDLGNRYREHTVWRTVSSYLETYYKDSDTWIPPVEGVDDSRLHSKRTSRSDRNPSQGVGEGNKQVALKRSKINVSLSKSGEIINSRKKSMQLNVQSTDKQHVDRMWKHKVEVVSTRRSNLLWVPNSRWSSSTHPSHCTTTYFFTPEISSRPSH